MDYGPVPYEHLLSPAGEAARFRRETSQIAASSEDEAIRQAQKIALERKPDRYTVTAIGSVAERIIFVSSAQ